MPKNAVKPESAEPYSEQTSLGGPVPKLGSYGVMPCKLKLSGKILAAAGMKPNDKVELQAESGAIVIRKTGEPSPALPFKSTNGTTRMLDALMAETRAFEAEQRAARERLMAYREEIAAEPEEPDELSDEQRRQEEL